MEFVEQLQQMVDTLGQTRALQEELRQALEMKAKTFVNNNVEENESGLLEVTGIRTAAEDNDFRTEIKVVIY